MFSHWMNIVFNHKYLVGRGQWNNIQEDTEYIMKSWNIQEANGN